LPRPQAADVLANKEQRALAGEQYCLNENGEKERLNHPFKLAGFIERVVNLC
jgi:hypothetical protein